jgi:hypothetical protein
MDDEQTLAENVPEKYKRRFRKACAELNKIQEEMRENGFPRTQYYLQEDSMILMVGDSHDGVTDRANYHFEVESVTLPGSGGGGW